MRSRIGIRSNRIEAALGHALSAREAGRAFGDSDLEGLGLVLAGQAWLFLGQTQRGLDALDEAGAAVIASGLSPWAGGLVYCGVIHSHLTRADWQRASEWTEQFTRWCESHGAPAYPGLCRMHRAEVLMVRGELVEAERELEATIETLARYAPWTQGDAWAVLGDVQLARGSSREALASFQRASEHGIDTCQGQARVRLHEGDAERAARQLEQNMHEEGSSFRMHRGMSLAYLALAAATAGKPARAREAIEQLTQQPELIATPSLAALVARARAEILEAESDRPGAIKQLRVALRMLQALGAPLPAAEVRRKLATLLGADGDHESAELELTTAINVFRRAGADGQVTLCERARERISSPA
jgi:tetratricopeptide (TPR) repeat protein